MQIRHGEFGLVEIKVNARARRFVFRFDEERRLVVTVPPRTHEADWQKAIDSMRDKLLSLKEKRGDVKRIDKDFRVDQPDFRMALREGNVPHVQARFGNGTLDVVYPSDTDFSSSSLQQWLLKVCEEALRHQAKCILPQRLMEHARRLGLTVTGVSIRNSHGRWGSCTSRKSINLSMYLVLLPRHLQDYVLLHELTHTLHMDHSDRFWQQLDQFCGTSSKSLRKELAAYDTSIFFRR